MRNILLATDGSKYADAAAHAIAQGHILQKDFTVHVTHCSPDLSGEVRAYVRREDIEAWHQDESGRAMKSVLEILDQAGIHAVSHALVGFAPERILALAKELGAEAIVMGTHGRGAFLDAVIGSVASRVLAHAPCPVILVKGSGQVS
ncbi:universal stress protein [Cupriavidus pauculus]|uniref:universal stress protein n=1 Tax=Cupriavidus pauculus TaxID=82633 RepID=UPI000A04308E|nr:universal stress protein [Cupriavidus pauculus]